MSFFELFLMAVSLAMDAFAVSIGKGLSQRKVSLKHMVICGVWFGGFQVIMPLIGFYLGTFLSEFITKYDHWVAFILLAVIGVNMIRESLDKDVDTDPSLKVKEMFLLAVATSIDALAVGVSYAFLSVNIWKASALIGIVAFILSAAGVKIGSIFGGKYRAKAEFAGGLILIVIGLRILLTGIGFAYF